ncbi:MAG TPA: hypothetical protein VF557_04195 [Jatrophihabitans sp.]|jgi:hypothetical protein|uniref:hypothetical protein n=1 Tax=Jatrophihabitans sp. TaxID=1932789 RepID=UPI002EFBE7E4
MNWGDVPAWLAIAVSLAALGRSWQAERRAREATAGAASLEVSLQRIADALDRSRVNAPPSQGSATGSLEVRGSASDSAPPLPEFSAEFVSGHSYRLRNVSTVRATGVTVTLEQFPQGMARNLPAEVELPPLASAGPFLIIGSWQSPAPTDVLVTCDQLSDPVRVPLPPRG